MASNLVVAFADVQYPTSTYGLGSISTIQVSGGTMPYSYAWTTSTTAVLAADGEPKRQLSAGSYTLTVTDSVGAQATRSIVLHVQLPLQVAVDRTLDDAYGSAVAVNGSSAVVGAPQWDRKTPSALTDSGTAVLLKLVSGVSWVEQAVLQPPTPLASAKFGAAVAVAGDYAVVGAPGYNSKGAAFVFFFDGTAWAHQATLLASNGANGNLFGCSVAIDGDSIVVGAQAAARVTPTAVSNCGAAYVFTRAGTAWTEKALLASATAVSTDLFGFCVGIRGTTVAAGAYQYDNVAPAISNAGAVFIFVTPDDWTTFSQQAMLVASDAVGNANFGYSLSLQPDAVVVGAKGATVAGVSNTGQVYLYTRSGSTWTAGATTAGLKDGTNFGTAVALSPDKTLLLVCAPNFSIPTSTGFSTVGLQTMYKLVSGSWQAYSAYSLGMGASSTSVSADSTYTLTGCPINFLYSGGFMYQKWYVHIKILPGTVTPVAVYNNAIGSIGRSHVVGGVPPYSVQWTPGSGATPITAQDLAPKTSLKAGSYQLIVTDSLAASASFTYVVTEPDASTAPPASTAPAGVAGAKGDKGDKGDPGEACSAVRAALAISGREATEVPLYSTSGGKISAVTVSGGKAPYSIEWSGPADYTFSAFGEQTDLVAGNYSAIISDSSSPPLVYTTSVDVFQAKKTVNTSNYDGSYR